MRQKGRDSSVLGGWSVGVLHVTERIGKGTAHTNVRQVRKGLRQVCKVVLRGTWTCVD